MAMNTLHTETPPNNPHANISTAHIALDNDQVDAMSAKIEFDGDQFIAANVTLMYHRHPHTPLQIHLGV